MSHALVERYMFVSNYIVCHVPNRLGDGGRERGREKERDKCEREISERERERERGVRLFLY